MKDRKYELADFALYDYAYVQRHLEEMAAKGWRLEKTGHFGLWRYRAAEPAKVRYEATYAPTGNPFNPWPTEQEEALEEFCAQAGWQKVAAIGPLHIYCNEDPNAVPIETDEAVRHRTIKASMKKQYVYMRILMMALLTFEWIVNLAVVMDNPVRALSSGAAALMLAALPTCVLLYGFDLGGYLYWMHRSEKAIRDGLPCPEGKFYRTYRIVAIVYLVVFVILLVLVSELWGILWVMVSLIPALAVCSAVIRLMQKKGYTAMSTRIVSALAAGAVVLVMMNVVGPHILGPMMGETDSIYRESLPLMAEQIADTGDTKFTNIVVEEFNSSLSSYTRCWNASNDGAQEYDLQYTIVDIYAGFLDELYLERMLEEYTISMEFFSSGVIYEQEPVGTAEHIWRCNAEGEDRLLIAYDDRIVRLSVNWELTERELSEVIEILNP